MKRIIFIFFLLLTHILNAQSDCISAIPVCGDSNISYNPQGPGNVAEPTSPSCLDIEHFSVWYTFTIGTSGTLEFTIDPDVFDDDYDFALYGPNFSCTTGNFGTPIRCNFSGASGPTGLSSTNTTSTWGTPINVVAGEVYYLVIDNYIPQNGLFGFDLTWGGSATLNSPFTDPSIQPNPFIEPGPNQDGDITVCGDPTTFDFSTLSAGIINGNPNFTVAYYLNSNDAITETNPITTPISVYIGTTYHYAISYTDPNNPNNPVNDCREFGEINFVQGNITPNNPTVFACNNKNVGIGTFDLTTAVLFTGTGNTTQYFPTLADAQAGTNQITNPATYQSGETIVYGLVTTPQNCTAVGEITLEFYPQLPLTPATVYGCNNNDIGSGTFDLTLANINADPAWTVKYYPTLTDVMAETNEITNTMSYQSSGGLIFALVTNNLGCSSISQITLEFLPSFEVYSDEIKSCFELEDANIAFFDLTQADVTAISGATYQYYPTFTDALNDTNEITTPDNYLSSNGFAYIRVTNMSNCWKVAEVKLTVLEPNYSEVLVDKTICIENRTTLDAGPGYVSYLWSNGATTQSISGVEVGTYWVDLTSDDGCTTHQIVNVYASEQPVVTAVEITNNTITITVNGGTPPYQYSLDKINWQDSNSFTGLERGEVTFYVKDFYDCDAVSTTVTVPNLVNAITPNGDNINDKLDYSALGYKKDLVVSIYDRYGNKVAEANKANGYIWDGRRDGKRVSTGNYWYTVTWTEPESGKAIKYTGWVLVKNRE